MVGCHEKKSSANFQKSKCTPAFCTIEVLRAVLQMPKQTCKHVK